MGKQGDIMMDLFPFTKLRKHCVKIGSGITPKGGETAYKAKGIPLIRSQNVLANRLDLSEVAFIDEAQHIKMSGSKVVPGDVLLNITGASIGRSCIVPPNVYEANVNQHVCIIRLKQSMDGRLLSNFLNSWFGQKQIWSFQGGGSREGLNYHQIGSFDIPVPPLPEQKAIADLLSTWDAAIEKAERLIRAKEKRLEAYGTMLFDHKAIKKRHDWKLAKLKDVLFEHENKSTGAEEVFSVSVHKGLVNQVEHLGRSFSAANTDNYNRVHYGDIVYTKSPTGDFPYGIVKQSYSLKDVIVSPLYGVFTPVNFEMGLIIDFYFSSPTRTRNYLYPVIQKGAKNTIAITNKTFLSDQIPLPADNKAQKSISNYIATAREEINLIKQLVEKYKSQKRGLMQKMLTGEWRLKSEIIKLYQEM